MKFLNTIWNDLRQGENIDLYLTIAVAIAVSIFNLFSVAPEAWIPTLTLTVLALLAITNLVNRHKLDDVIQNQNSRELFIEEYPETVYSDIKNAKELFLAGYHLSGTVIRLGTTIEEKLARKEKVTVLLIDPDSDACKYANASLLYPTTDEQFSDQIRISLNTFESIANKFPGYLNIYLIDHPIPFGTYAMNIDSPNGRMYIELYAYKGGVDEPRFVLNQKDGEWYRRYAAQFKALLNNAKEYKVL